jgi:hypothetical protein
VASPNLPDKRFSVARPVDQAIAMAEARSNLAILRDDEREEPSSKATENRLRTAFLATKGNTMAMWLAQRDELLSSESD